MPARIESAFAVHSVSGLLGRGARRLADAAARGCLERAQARASDVELLVNVGVYREDSLAEPALSAMIQEDIGANPGHPPLADSHGTFSFDINDGGRGLVTAFDLFDRFLTAGTIETGLVVASDVLPRRSDPAGLTIPSVGGAILLRRAQEGHGFSAFSFENVDPGDGTFESRVAWHEHAHGLLPLVGGRNLLDVEASTTFAARAADAAARAAAAFLREQGLRAEDLDLVIPSQHPVGFSSAFARALELPRERVLGTAGPFSGAHTAGPIAALQPAIEDARFQRARWVLFATVTAGLGVGLALYRP
jgi:3-oxoacyl-[acyl-carrier-protein] synthase-3